MVRYSPAERWFGSSILPPSSISAIATDSEILPVYTGKIAESTNKEGNQ